MTAAQNYAGQKLQVHIKYWNERKTFGSEHAMIVGAGWEDDVANTTVSKVYTA